MDLKEFEIAMIDAPCCNNNTVLGAIEAAKADDEELLDHMAFVMTDDIFKEDRPFYLPLVAALYRKIKNE